MKVRRPYALHLTAARERSTERHLVRVFEVPADRESASESGHTHAPAQTVGQEGRGRLASHVRIRREHDLLDPVSLDPTEQLVDPQMLGLDAVKRGERSTEDVVQPPILVRPLDRDQVDRLLDDADDRPVATGVLADGAELFLGQVPALLAEADALLDLLNRR